MFLYEVEFLRKRAGVPSRGQVAVCCYGNGGRFSCSGEEPGEREGRGRENGFGRKAGARGLKMERERSQAPRPGRNGSVDGHDA